MKTINPKLIYALMVACILTLSQCKSDDTEAGPCDDFQCMNGGSLISNVDGCQCECPPGYSGVKCEQSTCPVNIECPSGTSPNPANDCACE